MQKDSLTATTMVAILFLAIFLLAFLHDFPHTDANAIYHTPVSMQAVYAYSNSWNRPVQTEEQAVLAARLQLTTSRVRFTRDPKPALVERTTYGQAFDRLKSPDVTYQTFSSPKETIVWLVVFRGHYWIDFCPDNDCTPLPGIDGCAYAIIRAQDGESLDMGSRGDCQSLLGD